MPRLQRALLLCVLCGATAAQTPPHDDATEPLQHANLVVWFVGQPAPPSSPQPYTQYHEQTAGSFGRAASTVGTAASDTGVTSGNFPATATIGSKPASEVGQTSGSFGTPSSNIGQTAGTYGQPASTLGAPSSPAGSPAFTAPAVNWISWSSTQLSRPWRETLTHLDTSFPLQPPRIAFVAPEDLRDRLTATEGTDEYPDVLVGSPLLAVRASFPALADVTLAPLGKSFLNLAETGGREEPQPGDALILRRARHPEQARALLTWLSDRLCGSCDPRPVYDSAKLPAALAASAAETLLRGGSLGAEADPAFARLSPAYASFLALQPRSNAVLDDLSLRMDVLRAQANDRFAVVALRAIASSPAGFGVLHPLVVLRLGDGGRWRVLQISTDLAGDLLPQTFAQLQPYARRIPPEKVRTVTAVTQAAPVDNDTRTGAAELWWDNPGQATLLAVEWQVGGGETAGDTHLLLVPDTDARLRVRVTAPWPQGTGRYRWRVWSVGDGGLVALSPWRRITMLQ